MKINFTPYQETHLIRAKLELENARNLSQNDQAWGALQAIILTIEKMIAEGRS